MSIFKAKTLQAEQLLLITFVSIVLYLISVGFSLLLSSASLQKYTTESILGAYENTAVQLEATITRGLNFGRPLKGFVGLKEHLKRVQNTAPDVLNIAIFEVADKNINHENIIDEELVISLNDYIFSPSILKEKGIEIDGVNWIELENFHKILPVGVNPDNKEEAVAYLVLTVDKNVIQTLHNTYINNMIFFIFFVGVFTSLTMLGWFAFVETSDQAFSVVQCRVQSIILIFITFAQISFTGITVYNFNMILNSANNLSAQLSGRFLASDLEMLQYKGLHLQNFAGMQEHMQEILASSPSMGALELIKSTLNDDGKAESTILTSVGNDFEHKAIELPIYDYWLTQYTPRTLVGTVKVYPSREFHNSILVRMSIDQITSTIIAFVLLWKLTSFVTINIFSFKQRRRTKDMEENTVSELAELTSIESQKQSIFLETTLFMFFLAYDLIISFVPLVATQLPSQILPFSPSLLVALPISAESLLSMLAVIASGVFNKRLGWKTLMHLGIFSATIGAILSYIGYDIALFILARAFSGFGMGLFLMACQICVIETSNNDVNTRIRRISGVFAALFAGTICASAGGGMLYELFDFNIVFAISAFMMLLPLLLLSFLKRQKLSYREDLATEKREHSFRAFVSLSFLLPTFFISFPASITLTGFLFFAVPTSLNELGVNQANIARLFMLYGFCFIFIGPNLANFASKFKSQKYFVMLAGLTNGLSVFCAYLYPSYASFAFSVLLFGISQCLISSSVLEYILSLPKMQHIDKSVASSIYRTCEKSGQILGPMLFSLLLVRNSTDFYLFTALVVSLAFLFIILQAFTSLPNRNTKITQID